MGYSSLAVAPSPIEPREWVLSPFHWNNIWFSHISEELRYRLLFSFIDIHFVPSSTVLRSVIASPEAIVGMLEDLCKPVILTGSQLPIGMLRTDGKENLITAIEIAAARNENGHPMVPEVCIFFENNLLRGNRTTKINAENFNAFRSYNYPALATAGINIKYECDKIARVDFSKPLKPHYAYDTNVVVLTLFPGIQENIISNILSTPGLRAVVLKTYGAGNAPQKASFIKLLKEAIDKGIVIVNVSQCLAGTVQMRLYKTGLRLLDAGVISGYDSTVECLLTKLMFLLGQEKSPKEIEELMNTPMAGEFTKEEN